MAFCQTPPLLENQFAHDRVLRSSLTRLLPEDARREMDASLDEMGALAAGLLYRKSLAERSTEPVLTHWDAWGNRVDRIELSPLWKEMERIAAEKGLVATAYERKHGRYSRFHQFSLVYLMDPSSGVYSCPLAMTDGAAKTLLASANQKLIERAVPRLTSRDPARFWTSGLWMAERSGGSDVGVSETLAREEKGVYRLYGTKWFTSATTAQTALVLARPEGNPPGGSGLALLYVETRDDQGRWNGIIVNRLKDKLGTRMVPTAELTLDGCIAHPVAGMREGVRNITPMLDIIRTWNAVAAVAGMRRGVALARDYAKKRIASGARLAEKPLHADTLAAMHAEYEAAFHVTFRMIELLGKEEARELAAAEKPLFRLMVPIVKLTTAKQAISVASEVLEAFGGAGYVEDTGIPRLLRDAQVLPLCEGTTNVLSLDVLRTLEQGTSPAPLEQEVRRAIAHAEGSSMKNAGELALSAVLHASAWLTRAREIGPDALEAGARRFCLTLGRSLELALLVEHASHQLRVAHDGRSAAAARFFARTPIDVISEDDESADARELATYDD